MVPIDTPRIHDTRNDDNVPRARITAINNMALIVTEYFFVLNRLCFLYQSLFLVYDKLQCNKHAKSNGNYLF